MLSKNVKIKIYRTIILPVVLYGCETWSLTWREERRLRLFEKRVLRRICGPKRDDGTGELNDLYSSSNIVRVQIEKNETGGVCRAYGERRGVYRVLVEKSEGKLSLARPKRRWEDNIKMFLQEVGCGGIDWIDLA